MDEQEMELAYRTAVPVDDVDELRMSATSGFAVVWLDISDRPDLVVLQDKERTLDGYSVLTWFYNRPGAHNMQICLHVQMREPVQFALSLIFDVRRYISQLEAIARYGALWLVVGPPPDFLVGTQAMTAVQFTQKVASHTGNGLHISLQPHLIAELREKLAEWKRIK